MKYLLIFATLLFACDPKKPEARKSATAPASKDQGNSQQKPNTPVETGPKMSSGPNARVICETPTGLSGDPRSIKDVVQLINALPKPTSVACFIDALKGPFRVNATSSMFSAQPAYSEDAPRIFLFYEPLYISVVPRGIGGEAIEVSVKTEKEKSIKGEIPFPVKEAIADDLPYSHIAAENYGTVCGNCHFSEVLAGGDYPPNAYVSQFFVTTEYYDVSAKDIEVSAARCKKQVLPECQVLEALTSKGSLIQASFEP